MKRPYYDSRKGGHLSRIYNLDAATLLDSLPESSADIIFLDPPFNIGKRYEIEGFRDKEDPDIYFGWITAILRRAVACLKPGGALYFYHVPSMAYKVAAALDHQLEFRHWIAVSMKNGFVRGRRLYPAHYALLYFTKGEPSHFDRPKLRPTTCRHCGKLSKDYGGYRSIIEEKGINLSDFWEDLSPLRHKTTKSRKANELPPLLFDRILAISGCLDGTFVDPFLGSGGGLLAARRAHMDSIGGDASTESCELATQRLKQSEGELV